MKKLLRETADHAINRKQFGKPLKDFELMQEKFAKMACSIYAMESMAYLTAGNFTDQQYTTIFRVFFTFSVYCVPFCRYVR